MTTPGSAARRLARVEQAVVCPRCRLGEDPETRITEADGDRIVRVIEQLLAQHGHDPHAPDVHESVRALLWQAVDEGRS